MKKGIFSFFAFIVHSIRYLSILITHSETTIHNSMLFILSTVVNIMLCVPRLSSFMSHLVNSKWKYPLVVVISFSNIIRWLKWKLNLFEQNEKCLAFFLFNLFCFHIFHSSSDLTCMKLDLICNAVETPATASTQIFYWLAMHSNGVLCAPPPASTCEAS